MLHGLDLFLKFVHFLRENDFGFVLGDEEIAKKDPKDDEDDKKDVDK